MAPVTRSKKQKRASKTKKTARKTLTVSDIRKRFKEMDENVRSFLKHNRLNSTSSLGKHVSRQWKNLFNKPLSSKAANSLAQHYLNLHGKKQGGSAPLDYVMRPGLPAVATYATFPTEVGTDPKAVKDLDVYYNSALGRSCGSEDLSAKVPVGIGSNQVPLPASGPLSHNPSITQVSAPAPAPVALPPAKGGRRKSVGGSFTTTYSTNQQVMRAKGGNRKTKRNSRRATKRGGNILTTLNTRVYTASNPSTLLQRGSEAWAGMPVNPKDIADPSSPGWVQQDRPYVGPVPPVPTSIVSTDTLATANPSFYTPATSSLF